MYARTALTQCAARARLSRGARGKPWLGGACALALTLSLSACRREAPGPRECVLFADKWLRARGAEHAPPLVAQKAFDELVVRCLTEPYDRELVSCVLENMPLERCRIDYVRRVEARRSPR